MKARETIIYENVKHLFGEVKVELFKVAEFKHEQGNSYRILIIDEAENCIFESKMKLPRKGVGMVIGCTATALKMHNGLEKRVLFPYKQDSNSMLYKRKPPRL